MMISEMNFETYNGVLLDSREATVLRAIEELSHEKIPFVHQIPLHDSGCVVINHHVTEISLFWSNIEQLPQNFGDLSKLQSLILIACGLKTLPESFSCLECLQYIDLSENQLTRLPDFWGHFSYLHHLDLQMNSLETLPPSIGQLHSLTKLFVGANALEIGRASCRERV